MKVKTIAAIHSKVGRRINNLLNKFRRKVSNKEYEEVMSSFGAPQDIDNFMTENFEYEQDWFGGIFDNARCPKSMLYHKKDDCDSYAWFAYEALKQLGYEVFMVAIQFPSMKNWHVSCFFINGENLCAMDNWGYRKDRCTIQGLFDIYEEANMEKVSGCFFFDNKWETLLTIEKHQMFLFKHSSAEELRADLRIREMTCVCDDRGRKGGDFE